MSKHLWRNWLARSAVNRKVAGSSPARCVAYFFLIFTKLAICYNAMLYTMVKMFKEKSNIFFLGNNCSHRYF